MWCMSLSMGCLTTKVLLPPATKLGQGDVFTCVCDSVHRGGSAPLHAGTHTHPSPGTRGRHLPLSGPGTTHPRDQRHPIAQCMLGDTGSKRAVHILLECFLVRSNSTEEHNISYTSDNLFHVRTLRRKRFPSHFLSKCVFLLYYKI